MKRTAYLFKKLIAIILVIVFCAVQFTEAFHHHHAVKGLSSKSPAQVTNICTVCQFIAHQHHAEAPGITSLHFAMVAAEFRFSEILKTVSKTGFSDAVFNKGPPAFLG